MFRQHIHSTCYSTAHAFPVTMRFGGTYMRFGRPVYVMYCPVCGCEKHFEYCGYRGTRIRQVA